MHLSAHGGISYLLHLSPVWLMCPCLLCYSTWSTPSQVASCCNSSGVCLCFCFTCTQRKCSRSGCGAHSVLLRCDQSVQQVNNWHTAAAGFNWRSTERDKCFSASTPQTLMHCALIKILLQNVLWLHEQIFVLQCECWSLIIFTLWWITKQQLINFLSTMWLRMHL